MPYTVWGAFDTFRKNTVDLVADEVSRALVSRDYLIDQIKTLARTDATFPRTSGDAIPYGSFARKTKIRPLDDIDLLTCIPHIVVRVSMAMFDELLPSGCANLFSWRNYLPEGCLGQLRHGHWAL
jgi:hypothetical protein